MDNCTGFGVFHALHIRKDATRRLHQQQCENQAAAQRLVTLLNGRRHILGGVVVILVVENCILVRICSDS
jgi:hypothetical protein